MNYHDDYHGAIREDKAYRSHLGKASPKQATFIRSLMAEAGLGPDDFGPVYRAAGVSGIYGPGQASAVISALKRRLGK